MRYFGAKVFIAFLKKSRVTRSILADKAER